MKTLYQKTKLGKIQEWKIWVEANGESGFPEVHVEYGLSDGKKQTTFDVVKEGVNIGKANETTALEQANLTMERKITKQIDDGYVEELEDTEKDTSIDFSKPFPKELCFFKPKNSIDDKKLAALEKAKRAVFTVKRDGQMHIARMSDLGLEIYSRRMDLESAKYPHLMTAMRKMPKQTVLLGEIILDIDGKDNFRAVSSICRSDPEESIAKQKEKGLVKYYVFDIAFLKGKNLLTTTTFAERRKLLADIINDFDSEYVMLAEVINKPHKKAMQEIRDRKLEGLVVWDADGIMESDRAFTFNGKADRPNVIWKSKPKYEDDFIVRWSPSEGIGCYGKGKNKEKIKNVFIYQLDDAGNEIYLGKCGGGLSDAQRDFYTDAAKFPRVWRIEYDSIQPKTGALRFPVFNADRTLVGDKDMSECDMSDAIKEARAMEPEEDEEEEAEE